MPYIKQEERDRIDPAIEEIVEAIRGADCFQSEFDRTILVGELNYAISRILDECLSLQTIPSYAKFNAAIGVLECVKQELYRRLAAPYEDKKMAENGDVY